MEANQIIHGDCLDEMRKMDDDSVDLIVCSPPYEKARTYGIGFALSGQDWVDWMYERAVEMSRICKGLVVIVCEGQTRNYRYSCTPFLLMADLHRAGFNLRKPPIFHRVGIPGSGGPDWLRNDYEPCICITKPGRLPWSDNTAAGNACKFAVGGAMSNRTEDGIRRNKRTGVRVSGGSVAKVQTRRKPNGDRVRDGLYQPPEKANPGNVIKCIVGGGAMGSDLAHENEAPYPEKLAEFFVRSYCPPGGIVLDPYSGSGTTAAVAERWGRRWIGIDVRQSQVDLSKRRIAEVARPLFTPDGERA